MIKKYLFRLDKKFILKKLYDDINFDMLEDTCKYHDASEAQVDNITWNDLDMNEVYSNLNHTVSSPGEEVLYNWMKNPLVNKDSIKQRNDDIIAIQESDTRLKEFRLKLSKLGYCKFNIRESLEKDFLVNMVLLVFFVGIALLNLGLAVFGLLTGTAMVFPVLLLTSAITIVSHFRFLLKYESQLEVLRYIIRMIGVSRKYSSVIKDITPDKYDRIAQLNVTLKSVTRNQGSFYRVEGIDLLADYVNILFLVKEIRFLFATQRVNKYREEIVELYKCIGEIDALTSIGIYRDTLDYYSVPDIEEDKKEIKIVDMYHPLLDEPISNTIEMNNSIVITGSNMSGKSTFLRTLSINAILAQSLCSSLSKKHLTSSLKVITSISLKDDVTQGKSYFMMEAEAIQRMIELKDSDISLLVAIDEIFKGTNPVERLAASTEILNELADSNTLTMVATHDLQILPELIGFDYYYFTENVTKHSLDFDYKLHSGISPTRNAVKLLEYIKYPEEIIDKINNRIEVLEV